MKDVTSSAGRAHVLGPGNHHPIEYQVFFMNLRQNAQQRVRAFLGR